MDLQSVVVTDVESAFSVYSPKGRRSEIRCRPSYGLSFCDDDGRITYLQEGRKVTESRHSAVILPQGQSYFLHGDEEGSFPVINFFTLEPLCREVTAIPLQSAEFLMGSFEELQRLLAVGTDRARILSVFYGMLSYLSPRAEVDRLLAPALRYIDAHYRSSELTNADLAGVCKISEVYFRKLFRSCMGISPKQYVLSLRLQRAKQLLAEGKEKVCAVASECGFESVAHFSRSFREQVGMTPVDYRRKNQSLGI